MALGRGAGRNVQWIRMAEPFQGIQLPSTIPNGRAASTSTSAFRAWRTTHRDCFDVMWAKTEDRELAGKSPRTPSTVLGIHILALHALRSPHLPASRQELEF